VHAVLAGECGDDALRDLLVESVVPAPNSSRLLVTLVLGPGVATVAAEDVLVCLHRAQGLLRAEVAAAINRKRVPELTFRLVGPADVS
jgi:ribosome-binding factor A